MAQPQAYNREVDFTERDGDDTNHAGINAELDAAALSVNQIRTNLALIQRDDGGLKAGIVDGESLAPSAFDAVLEGVNAGVTDAQTAAASATIAATTAISARDTALVAKTNAETAAAAAQLNATIASEQAADAASLLTQVSDGVKTRFVAGTHYTINVSTSLTLGTTPLKPGTVAVYFAGVYQESNTYTLSGTTLTFNAPIAAASVEVLYDIGRYFAELDAAVAAADADAATATTRANQATNQAIAAAASASQAATSATSAATSASNAAASASAAASSSASASGSATAASNSAANASSSAATATAQAANASNSASAASGFAINASVSANNSASSASAASASAAAAAASYDNFDDRYLGAKASDPTLDNDGSTLLDGALYWDTTNNVMKVYDLGNAVWKRTTPSSADQAKIDAVTANATNINAVAGNASNINAVAANATNINTVSNAIASVDTVAVNIAGIQTTVANLPAILDADNQAAAANASAGQAAGSAAQALAIYGNTEAMQTAVAQAAAQASLAQGYAASASSVVQQDLSGVNAAALHRSPNAVTAMFVYDTSKASDGGVFIEKLDGLSLATESLNGKWLGQQANEAAARAVSGATTGDYYQQTSDGKIYRLLATSGISQTYRGNKRDWPRLMGMVTESQGLFVYDLTEPGRPLWRHFPVGANEVVFAAPTSIGALNSIIAIGTASGLVLIDFARDVAKKLTTGADQTYKGVLAVATAGWAT